MCSLFKGEDILNYKKGNNSLVLLEGLHAVKHAYRFGSEFEQVFCGDRKDTLDLAKKHAPDILDFLEENLIEIGDKIKQIFPKNLHGEIGALAKKKENLNDLRGAIVYLENPNSINNFGAVVRVLAARGVKNLIVSGAKFSAWHKDALRTGAGLHFALDNIFEFENTKEALIFLKKANYKIYALDPSGTSLKSNKPGLLDLESDICLVFGTESEGLSKKLKEAAGSLLRIPMQKGVSSMNLATSVAATLYMINEK